MSSVARRIYLPSASALAALVDHARAALEMWARQWVSGWNESDHSVAAVSIEYEVGSDTVRAAEYECMSATNGSVWFRRNPQALVRLGRAVVGSELMPRSACADDWIKGVIDQAWEARNRAMCVALLGEPTRKAFVLPGSELPAKLFAFGSGTVRVSCEPLGLQAIAGAGVWNTLPPAERKNNPLPKPTALERAAAGANVCIEVTLGSVELTLPNLIDLRHGDVLRLPQRLDQPLVVSCEGEPFGRAVLGAAGGRKSIQLTAKYQ